MKSGHIMLLANLLGKTYNIYQLPILKHLLGYKSVVKGFIRKMVDSSFGT